MFTQGITRSGEAIASRQLLRTSASWQLVGDAVPYQQGKMHLNKMLIASILTWRAQDSLEVSRLWF